MKFKFFLRLAVYIFFFILVVFPGSVYEPNRNHLDKKQIHLTPALGGTNVSSFDYAVNAIGQRIDLVATGSAFTEGAPTLQWGYTWFE